MSKLQDGYAKLSLWAAIATLYLTGCTTSVHPFLNEGDLSKDLDLSGQWEQMDVDARGQKRVMTLQGVDGNARYDLQLDREEEKSDVIRIGKLGNTRYAEIKGSTKEDGGSPFQNGLPVYALVKFELKDDQLHFYIFDEGAIHKLLDRSEIPHLRYRPGPGPGPGPEWIVLTGTTEQLQKLLKEHGDQIFSKTPSVWRRKQ